MRIASVTMTLTITLKRSIGPPSAASTLDWKPRLVSGAFPLKPRVLPGNCRFHPTSYGNESHIDRSGVFI
jgi:hypothetical protein